MAEKDRICFFCEPIIYITMKRKLYFWIDRLQIRRSERISIGVLLILLCVLSIAEAMITPSINADPEHYAELEQIFSERSERAEAERNELLARYIPLSEHSEPEKIANRGITHVEVAAAEKENVKDVWTGNLVNINTATSEELQQLPGIGPAYADRIIEWREENGKFTSIEQLLEIRGIGERRLENLRPLVTIDDENDVQDDATP